MSCRVRCFCASGEEQCHSPSGRGYLCRSQVIVNLIAIPEIQDGYLLIHKVFQLASMFLARGFLPPCTAVN